MAKRFTNFYAAVAIALVCACSGPAKTGAGALKTGPAEGSNGKVSIVNGGQAWAAAWQQQAGEYKALCFQAFYIARIRIDLLLQQSRAKPPAIVTDIDETVLDNSPYTVHQALQGKGYTEESWVQWTSLAGADTVPGALSFLQYAKSKGVSIFYVTNRMEKERGVTLQNLKKWGFPDADNEHLLLKQQSSGKEPRRQQVLTSNEILLLMGDNLSDFSALFDKQPLPARNNAVISNASQFGSRFIILPNPMYGDWEGGYYRFKYDLDERQKDSAVKSVLKGF